MISGLPEIGQPVTPATIAQYVMNFDIAMYDAGLVRTFECSGQAHEPRLTFVERNIAGNLVERFAIDELHHDKRAIAVAMNPVNLHNRGMTE